MRSFSDCMTLFLCLNNDKLVIIHHHLYPESSFFRCAKAFCGGPVRHGLLVQRALHTLESQPRNTKATEADQNVDQAVQTGPRKTRDTLHQGDFCTRFLVYFKFIFSSFSLHLQLKAEKNPFELGSKNRGKIYKTLQHKAKRSAK